jgi:hypothetical protein
MFKKLIDNKKLGGAICLIWKDRWTGCLSGKSGIQEFGYP